MQPSSQPVNSFPTLSQGVCGSGLAWPQPNPLQPSSVYGTYLTAGQTFPGSLSPMAALSTQFPSVSDPNTSALLAAAAAFQQQQQAMGTPTLISVSPTAKSSLVNGTGCMDPCGMSHHSLNASSRSAPLPSVSANGHHLGIPSRVTTVSEVSHYYYCCPLPLPRCCLHISPLRSFVKRGDTCNLHCKLIQLSHCSKSITFMASHN